MHIQNSIHHQKHIFIKNKLFASVHLRSIFCAQYPVHSHHTRPSRSTFLGRCSNSTRSNLQSTQNTFAQVAPQSLP